MEGSRPPLPLIRSHVGLRGLAALLVVAYHLQFGAAYLLPVERATPLFARGYLAVDLFFVLSGFIISYVYGADRADRLDARAAKRFRQARFARLYPLLAFSLLLMVLLALVKAAVYHAAGRPSPVDFGARSLGILASQAVLLNAWIPGAIGWNIPSWSISAEAAAYVLFPLLVVARARAPRRFEAGALFAAASFYIAVATTTGSLDVISGTAPLRCGAGFLLGMLIYYHRSLASRLATRALSVIQLVCAGAILVLLGTPVDDPLIMPFYVALVASTWPDRGILAWALSRRPLQRLGDISYSVYLNHLVVIDALNEVWPRLARLWGLDAATERAIWLPIAFAGVIATSILTFRHVERPARRWLAGRFTGAPVAPIAASPAAP